MYKKPVITLMLASLTLPVISYADVDDGLLELRDPQQLNVWIPAKNDAKKNIKTWYKSEDGKKIRSFKVDTLLNGSLITVAHVFLDIDNYTRWFWQVREAKVVQKISPTEFVYYVQHHAPVTLPDRDAYIRVTIEPYSSQKGYATFRLKAIPDFMPEKPPLVRMLGEDMLIKLTPIGKEQVRVEVEGFLDPGGRAPTWAINAVQKQAPYYTVLGLQRMVQQSQILNTNEPLPFKLFEEEKNQ